MAGHIRSDMKLFLDDVRAPNTPGWDVVRSYDAFEQYIEANGVPELISFDHDLSPAHYANMQPSQESYEGFAEKTGYDCAKLLVALGKFPDRAIVHSWNPGGSRNIANALAPHCKVYIYPYPCPLIF
jgi:hypothetical protein